MTHPVAVLMVSMGLTRSCFIGFAVTTPAGTAMMIPKIAPHAGMIFHLIMHPDFCIKAKKRKSGAVPRRVPMATAVVAQEILENAYNATVTA